MIRKNAITVKNFYIIVIERTIELNRRKKKRRYRKRKRERERGPHFEACEMQGEDCANVSLCTSTGVLTVALQSVAPRLCLRVSCQGCLPEYLTEISQGVLAECTVFKDLAYSQDLEKALHLHSQVCSLDGDGRRQLSQGWYVGTFDRC